MSCVYLARNKVNGKGYVGKTTATMKIRKINHETMARRGSDECKHFHRALRKYGFDVFVWEVIHENENEDELNSIEREMIRLWKTRSPHGYNLTDGGDGTTGHVRSQEWRDRQRASKTGKRHSAETRAKQRLATLKRYESPEERLKTARSSTGRVHLPETRAKIRKANLGRPKTEEAKANMRKAWRLRKLKMPMKGVGS